MSLRVVSGIWRGKGLDTLKSKHLRPTSAKLRKVIFDLVSSRFADDIENIKTLDLFAGAGTLGIEALSIGVSHVTFVDNHPSACKVIRRNLQCVLGAESKVNPWVIRCENAEFIKKRQYDHEGYSLVMIDPPYNNPELVNKAIARLVHDNWLKPKAYIFCEYSQRKPINVQEEALTLEREKKYGDTILAIFSHHSDTRT